MVYLGEQIVELKPSAVSFNGESLHVSEGQMMPLITPSGETIGRVIALREREYSIVSERYGLKLTYDGVRVRLTLGSFYRDSIRGLCGTFNTEPSRDLVAPQNCVLSLPSDMLNAYALDESSSNRSPKGNCVQMPITFADVINPQGSSSHSRPSQRKNSFSSCKPVHYTAVVHNQNEYCFSAKPLPKCKSSCKPKGEITSAIQFHCLPEDRTSTYWAQKAKSEHIINVPANHPKLSTRKYPKTFPVEC